MGNRPFKKEIKYTGIYYFVRFLIGVSNLMPRRWWLAFCGFLGRMAYMFAGQSRKRALLHLSLAYGIEKTPAEILVLSKRMFIMLGKNAGEVLRARAIRTLADLDKFLAAENLDAIVTRNTKHYKNSVVKVYSPTEFLNIL